MGRLLAHYRHVTPKLPSMTVAESDFFGRIAVVVVIIIVVRLHDARTSEAAASLRLRGVGWHDHTYGAVDAAEDHPGALQTLDLWVRSPAAAAYRVAASAAKVPMAQQLVKASCGTAAEEPNLEAVPASIAWSSSWHLRLQDALRPGRFIHHCWWCDWRGSNSHGTASTETSASHQGGT